MNKLYEDYIGEKIHEQLIEMAKRMLGITLSRLRRLLSIPVWSWQR